MSSLSKSGADRLTVEVVRSATELGPEVDDLARECGAPFYYTREFLTAYEQHPVQPVSGVLYLRLLDEDGRLAGLVPCYLQGDPLSALGIEPGEQALLSHCWHCYDSRLLVRDSGLRAAEVVFDAMRELAHAASVRRYGLINVARDSPTAAVLDAAGPAGRPLDTRYWLDLARYPDERAYLAALRRGPRHEYERYLRRAAEAGVEIAVREPTSHESMRGLRLLETSVARVGSASYYDAERIAALLGLLPRSARIIEISVDAAPVAVGVLFVEQHRVHTWAAGYDRESGLPFSPYYLLYAASVRFGLQAGVPILEGGRRNDRFKLRYGMAPIQLLSYVREVC